MAFGAGRVSGSKRMSDLNLELRGGGQVTARRPSEKKVVSG